MALLFSSATITHFSAFAQSTPRPYYTVLETPTHIPDTLYAKTPAEFITKVTNQGTGVKTKYAFVKMSHPNDAGITHEYTCDATSGEPSLPVNLNPGDSIDLHWNCEIFNSGTYTLTILDKTFTYTIVAENKKQEIQQKPIPENKPQSTSMMSSANLKDHNLAYSQKPEKMNLNKDVVKKAYLLTLWDTVSEDKILKLRQFELDNLNQQESLTKSNDKKAINLKQKIAISQNIEKTQITLISTTLGGLQNQADLFKSYADKTGISKSDLDKIASMPLQKINESKKISTLLEYKKAKDDLKISNDQTKKTRGVLLSRLGLSKTDITNYEKTLMPDVTKLLLERGAAKPKVEPTVKIPSITVNGISIPLLNPTYSGNQTRKQVLEIFANRNSTINSGSTETIIGEVLRNDLVSFNDVQQYQTQSQDPQFVLGFTSIKPNFDP